MNSATLSYVVPDGLMFAKPSQWTVPFAAGGISGVCAALVGQPFDTIKVRMQTGFKIAGRAPGGAVDCLKMTVKHEGANALFKGLWPQLGSQFLATALLFGIQDRFLTTFSRASGRSRGDLDLISAAGFCAGGVLAVITCPMELIKVGIQSADGNAAAVRTAGGRRVAGSAASSSLELAVGVARRVGLKGLYTGVGLTSLRCAIGNAAFFGCFEVCSRADRGHSGAVASADSHRSAAKNAFFGAIAGTAYWLVCYPIDLVKSQRQSQVVKQEVAPAQRNGGRVRVGLSQTPLGAVVRAQGSAAFARGLAGMYRGLGVTLVRGIPVASVGWAVFGGCTEALRE